LDTSEGPIVTVVAEIPVTLVVINMVETVVSLVVNVVVTVTGGEGLVPLCSIMNIINSISIGTAT